jgi:hypothetical protein
VIVGSAPASVPCRVYTTGDSTLAEGIVTRVDAAPLTASSDTPLAIDARLLAVLDVGVTVRGKPTFNDDIVVMVRCLLFSAHDCGRLRDERHQSIYRQVIENL